MRQYFLCLYEGFDLALMVLYFLVERNHNLFDFQVGPPEIPDLHNYTEFLRIDSQADYLVASVAFRLIAG